VRAQNSPPPASSLQAPGPRPQAHLLVVLVVLQVKAPAAAAHVQQPHLPRLVDAAHNMLHLGAGGRQQGAHRRPAQPCPKHAAPGAWQGSRARRSSPAGSWHPAAAAAAACCRLDPTCRLKVWLPQEGSLKGTKGSSGLSRWHASAGVRCRYSTCARGATARPSWAGGRGGGWSVATPVPSLHVGRKPALGAVCSAVQ
jgi:hypothetical protein